MNLKIKKIIFTLAAVFSISGCLPYSEEVIITDYVPADSLITMENYSIRAPKTDWWFTSYDKSGDAVNFSNMKAVDTIHNNYITITIYRVNINYGEYSIMDGNSIFTKYYAKIEEVNNKNFDRTGYCRVEVLSKDTITINNKHLFHVNYNLFRCQMINEQDTADGTGNIYFYFPFTYKRERVFYLFRIEQFFRKNSGRNLQLKYSDVENFIAGFTCREDTT